MPNTKALSITDPDAELVISDVSGPDPEAPATFILDQVGADMLREVLDQYFPRPAAD